MYAPGDMIANRYVVISTLGRGAQGEVYRVQDTVEGDEVALKMLGPMPSPLGPWAEAQILRGLVDDHILPIRNALVHLGQRVIVTEIALHGSVEDRINAQPTGLDVGDAIRWTRQACQGVARTHDMGLIHNDLKPGNLFLHERDDCCVADFGYAGQRNPAGVAPVYGATPETMAPEVAAAWAGGATATVSADIYSLAASCFWMLAGRPPHDLTGLAVAQKLHQVATVPAPRLREIAPHVPDTIARVVDRALSVDPDDRPASALDLAAALGRRIEGRRWMRTDEHAGHHGCWRGHPGGNGSEYVMCMTTGATPNARVIETRHARSGRMVGGGAATATHRNWAAAVRRVMRAVA